MSAKAVGGRQKDDFQRILSEVREEAGKEEGEEGKGESS